MAGDYIPHSESQLRVWADTFVKFVEDHADELPLTPDELAALIAGHQCFSTAYAEFHTAQAAVASARAAKDDARKAFVQRLRSIAMRIQSVPAIDAADKRGLGLSTGAPIEHVPLGVSDETPHALIGICGPMKHVIRILNRTPTGTRRARPSNAFACEVWRKIGDRPSGPSEMEYVGFVSKSPFAVEYPDDDAGKQAHYMLRWVGRGGARGNWSNVYSATIAA